MSGLKVSQLKKLEKIYRRRIPPAALVTPEFAASLTEVSAEIRRQVGVLVNRKGEVEYVIVGDRSRIELPDFKRVRTAFHRFRGLRCIHTHLTPQGLNRDDLTDLSLLRLDCMTAVETNAEGRPEFVHTAHLAPDFQTTGEFDLNGVWQILPKRHISNLDLDFATFIRDLEGEFMRKTPVHWRQGDGERAILIGVTTAAADQEQERMDELEELARATDVTVLDRFVQRRTKLDPHFVMGKGKLQEVIIRSMQLGASLLIFNQNLTPNQMRTICRETDLKVIDRTQLILDIFARRAQSLEGKIQVEVAQLNYMMPRLVEFDDALSRLTGGIGGRGPGETDLEINRRRLQDRVSLLTRKLDAIRRSRQQRRHRRDRRDVPVISIVGYTNAGKSTLLNAMTNSSVRVEDKYFATLDPVSRRLRLPHNQDIILSDTVGFIRDLPDELREAFKATLEEIEDASLIIHLVDAASVYRSQHMESVNRLLAELGLHEIPCLLVMNKVDLVDEEEREYLRRRYSALLVSARRGDNLEQLAAAIRENVMFPVNHHEYTSDGYPLSR